MITSCAVQMSDCVQASQCRPLGWAQPGDAHWQHSESSCAQVLSSAAHCSDVGQTDTALCLHMVVVYASCLFTCFLCTCCFLLVSHDNHCSAWSSLFFKVFERLADDGPPEVLWVHATMSIFKRQLHCSFTFYWARLHLVSGPVILVPIVIKYNKTCILFSTYCSHINYG